MRSLKDVLQGMQLPGPRSTPSGTTTTPTGPRTTDSSPSDASGHLFLNQRPATADEANPLPDCPHCRGVGWVRRAVPVTDPRFPSVLAVCDCLAERQAERRWREGLDASNMGAGLARLRFDTFDAARQPVAYDLARAFAGAIADGQPTRWLALFGGTGTGKTMLLASICGELIQRGHRPVYWLVPDLVAHLQAGYGAGDFPARFDAVRDAEVLLLDEYDVGIGQDQGARERARDRDEKMFMLLNHRLNHALPTALATNARLEQFPPRTASRLSDASVVDAVAMRPGDYRLEK